MMVYEKTYNKNEEPIAEKISIALDSIKISVHVTIRNDFSPTSIVLMKKLFKF